MNYKIAVIKGDGIGPEIVVQTQRVLDEVGKRYGHSFEYTDVLMGGIAIDETGEPLPQRTVEVCRQSDSVLLGAVGGPKWDTLPGHLRPEAGLLGIRGALGLYANIRPAILYGALKDACPLRADIVGNGLDLVVIRELTGGIYFGERGRSNDGTEAYDTERYSIAEIERIGVVAFETAMKRSKRLVSIDKANVLESSRLWRETMHKLAEKYPEVAYSDMLVDNAAMQLVRNPGQFDVIVTSNLFGDILSDEASMITGSIGMLPSSSIGEGTLGLYEPIHGSAPDIAGQNKANPIATILSACMMLRYSFGLSAEALAVEDAIEKTLNDGLRTLDIKDANTPSEKILGTVQMTDEILKRL